MTALEFFAGIGLARAGMENVGVTTVWANDFDQNKRAMYSHHWGDDHLTGESVFDVDPTKVPTADIAWSSSPCTDLSLAGKRSGIGGKESSAFFGFIDVLKGMHDRLPSVVVLENVVGLATSHQGEDLKAAIAEFNDLGYTVDVIIVDAKRFIPQSRPRLFIIGALHPCESGKFNHELRPKNVAWIHEDPTLETFVFPFPQLPELRDSGFTELAEKLDVNDTRWWDEHRVQAFLASMSETQKARADKLISSKEIVARTAYRRTRNGIPTWEMRAEDIAGCLRTARGGSSKQAVAVMGRGALKVRWMTGIEYARLMGAGWYNLEGLRDSAVHYGFGDAVAVDVVEWISKHCLVPLVLNTRQEAERV